MWTASFWEGTEERRAEIDLAGWAKKEFRSKFGQEKSRRRRRQRVQGSDRAPGGRKGILMFVVGAEEGTEEATRDGTGVNVCSCVCRLCTETGVRAWVHV